LREFFNNRWIALCGFIVVIASSVSLYLGPQNWLWILLPSVLFWGSSTVLKKSRFIGPSNFAAFILFVMTAAVGVWAAYDETAAWNKFCLIIAAVLFYVAVVEQPQENLRILAGFWFIAGVGIAAYFLVTFDFGTQAVKFDVLHRLGLLWMKFRPISLSLPSIHPNDTAGLSIIMASFGLAFLAQSGPRRLSGWLLLVIVAAGLGIAALAVVLASSRGAILALAGSTGIWFSWRALLRWRSPLQQKLLAIFPVVVAVAVFSLGALILFIPFRLLGSTFTMPGNVSISRMELVRSGLTILRDFPFTGGGLSCFPGLYSQYVLVIPFYSILHSHNMFLDVAVEQGILGGISFAFIYLWTIWQLLTAWRKNLSGQMQLLFFAAGLSLFTAIFHGMVDDYIYGGRGTLMAFISVAMSLLISRIGEKREQGHTVESSQLSSRLARSRFLISWKPWAAMTICAVIAVTFPWNSIFAQWYANLGAVKMSKVDLASYPANRWYDGTQTDKWLPAENDFLRALHYQADNATANHRLGLIRLMSRDFGSAADYLSKAYVQETTNRGVIKNLGYSFVWLGQPEAAQPFLERIPEAKGEMGVYVWWWGTQNRDDLAENADRMFSRLAAVSSPQ